MNKPERNAEVLAKQIRAWEMRAGESFTDYYMDGHVKPVSWAFWLLGAGYTEKANFLIDVITKDGGTSLDQTEMFHIHYNDEVSWTDWDAGNAIYEKDFLIWAQFLVASDRYWKDIDEWLTEEMRLHQEAEDSANADS